MLTYMWHHLKNAKYWKYRWEKLRILQFSGLKIMMNDSSDIVPSNEMTIAKW